MWGVGVGCGSGLHVGWGSEREGLQSRRHLVQLYSDALAVPTEASTVHKRPKGQKAFYFKDKASRRCQNQISLFVKPRSGQNPPIATPPRATPHSPLISKAAWTTPIYQFSEPGFHSPRQPQPPPPTAPSSPTPLPRVTVSTVRSPRNKSDSDALADQTRTHQNDAWDRPTPRHAARGATPA